MHRRSFHFEPCSTAQKEPANLQSDCIFCENTSQTVNSASSIAETNATLQLPGVPFQVTHQTISLITTLRIPKAKNLSSTSAASASPSIVMEQRVFTHHCWLVATQQTVRNIWLMRLCSRDALCDSSNQMGNEQLELKV